jgi:hypothetical protein
MFQPAFAGAQIQAQAQNRTLAPGMPAGVHKAQSGNLLPVYGGVILFAGILYATIVTSGSSVAPSTVNTANLNANGLTTG